MPTELVVQEWGEDPSFVAADPTGNFFRNVGNLKLVTYNGSRNQKSLEVITRRACNHGVVQNRTLDLRSGYTEEWSEFSAQQFNDASGNLSLTYPSDVTGVLLAVQKLPRR